MKFQGWGEFFAGLGERVTGTDPYSESATALNIKTSEYLDTLAKDDPKEQQAVKSDNTLIYAGIGITILTIGVVGYYILKKK